MTSIPALLERLGSPRLLVVGDVILDRYVEGNALKVSPEAPVLVFESVSSSYRLGGAANVAANVVALGGKAAVLGVVGEDGAAGRVRDMMRQQGIEGDLLVADAARPTTSKTRYVSRTHQVLRVDEERREPLDGSCLEKARELLRRSMDGFQGVILSDYAKGMLGGAFVAAVVEAARPCGIPVVVDPKGSDYGRYRGATLATPNREEAELATGLRLREEAGLDEAARRLMAAADLDAAVITLGKDGIFYRTRDGGRGTMPTQARAVFDVTGAGDTVVATLGCCLAGGLPLVDGVALANAAAGIVVGRFGTASVTRQELLALHGGGAAGKVLSRAQLPQVLARLRAEGRSVVFTNGCFDLLHPGHADYLRQARSYGDLLVVGVNDDASVRRLKGPGRPVCPLPDRMELLAALEAVDHVVPFSEDTPLELVREVAPDVLVKGADWGDKGVVGSDLVEARGGRVVLVPLKEGQSTTALLRRIRDQGAPPATP